MGIFVAGRYSPMNIWLMEELNVQKVERNVVGEIFWSNQCEKYDL